MWFFHFGNFYPMVPAAENCLHHQLRNFTPHFKTQCSYHSSIIPIHCTTWFEMDRQAGISQLSEPSTRDGRKKKEKKNNGNGRYLFCSHWLQGYGLQNLSRAFLGGEKNGCGFHVASMWFSCGFCGFSKIYPALFCGIKKGCGFHVAFMWFSFSGMRSEQIPPTPASWWSDSAICPKPPQTFIPKTWARFCTSKHNRIALLFFYPKI